LWALSCFFESMFKICFWLFAFFCFKVFNVKLVLAKGASPRIEVADFDTRDALLPAHFVDFSGFALPPSFEAASSLAGMEAPVPVFPMFKKRRLNRDFVGVKVPQQYLGQAACNSGARNIIITGTNRHWPEQVRKASAMLSRVKLPDGHRLNVYYHNCDLIGISSAYQVVYSNNVTIGLSIGGGNQKNTISLGDNFVLGMSLHLGTQMTYMNERGFNLGSGFNSLFEDFDVLLNSKGLESMIESTMSLTPIMTAYLVHNARSSVLVDRNDPLLVAAQNETIEVQSESGGEILPSNLLTPELQQALQEFQKESVLAKEIEWKRKVKAAADATLVVKDKNLQTFIQHICDHASQVYNLPQEIWPRCRVAATFAPNAWAYPGGDVFFSAGLIGVLSDLDGLMLVVGHEIGHVAGRHTTKFIPKANAVMYSANAVGLVANLGLTAFSFGGGLGFLGEVTWLSWFPQAVGGSIAGGYAASAAFQTLFFAPMAALMAHSRANERQADRFGLEVAYATGSRVEAMNKGWQEFGAFFADNFPGKESMISKIMSSHPSFDSRLDGHKKRVSQLHPELRKYNRGWRLPEGDYSLYHQYHRAYKQSLDGWVLDIKRRQNRALAASSTFRGYDSADLFLSSYLSPGASCIMHALGGDSASR
jgi:Zn-dependent protease with chaperone function